MSRTIHNFALVGARGHHGVVLPEISRLPECRLAAASFPDRDAASAERELTSLKNAGHEPRALKDWKEAINGVDAAIICGPFEQHAEMSAYAIERGVHVLCEKPAALEWDQFTALQRACEARPDVHFACMMFSRYNPGFYTARQMVARGEIGDVRLINARKSYKMGQRADYYRDRHTYGGSIGWVGSHAIDWSLWMLAEDDVVTDVHAFHTRVGNHGNGDLEAVAACQFRTKREVIGSISIDMLRPQSAKSHGDDWIRIVGGDGVIEARGKSAIMTNAAGADVTVPLESPSLPPLADFIAHAEGRSIALNTRESAFAVTGLFLRARESADARGA